MHDYCKLSQFIGKFYWIYCCFYQLFLFNMSTLHIYPCMRLIIPSVLTRWHDLDAATRHDSDSSFTPTLVNHPQRSVTEAGRTTLKHTRLILPLWTWLTGLTQQGSTGTELRNTKNTTTYAILFIRDINLWGKKRELLVCGLAIYCLLGLFWYFLSYNKYFCINLFF